MFFFRFYYLRFMAHRDECIKNYTFVKPLLCSFVSNQSIDNSYRKMINQQLRCFERIWNGIKLHTPLLNSIVYCYYYYYYYYYFVWGHGSSDEPLFLKGDFGTLGGSRLNSPQVKFCSTGHRSCKRLWNKNSPLLHLCFLSGT